MLVSAEPVEQPERIDNTIAELLEPVDELYRYGAVAIESEAGPFQLQPIDYVGETPLSAPTRSQSRRAARVIGPW